GEATPPSGPPAERTASVGRPSARLFEPTISTAASAAPGSSADPVTGKTAGPITRREAPRPEGGGGQRAPEGASGAGAGQSGATPPAARDDNERSAAAQSGAKQDGAEQDGAAPAPDGNAVVIVPRVARYHRTGCILIRFLG